jgi:hypothetical protein
VLPDACLAFVDHGMEHGESPVSFSGLSGKVGGGVLEPHYAIVAACM